MKPIKNFYSNNVQRDFFFSKFIPLIFLYGIFANHLNWWKHPFYHRFGNKIYKSNKYFFKKLFNKVTFREKRYFESTESKFAFFLDDGSSLITIPLYDRKSFFSNYYFSKIWMMHVQSFYILKIHIVIPRTEYNKNWVKFMSKVEKKKYVPSSVFKQNYKILDSSFNPIKTRKYYMKKKKINLLKNLFFLNIVKNKNKFVENFIWF